MDNKVAFFLPTRKGSMRVVNKNTRPFSQFEGGLIENKVRQLVHSEKVDEILLSTNDEECIDIVNNLDINKDKIKIIERPEELCLDTTNLKDLIAYVPTITDARHILWGHVTTPLANGNDYDEAIGKYLKSLKKDMILF
ncbi:cytidylyltransferase domain-containing protein [Pseudarcicella hirudinis]|uniref:cytidylyltransferase domain-containing protein n=1 Tax=Pseudarcicella hirudinis TaxID=1079859 RepID=UPI0035ED07F8